MAAKPLHQTSLIADANLVSYYNLNGNSNDYKGNANGTDTSITYQTSPRVNSDFDQTANFNNSSDLINATRSTGLSGSFTIMCWIYFTTGSVENSIVESHVVSYNNYWAYMAVSGSNKFNVNLYDGTFNPSISGSTTLSTSTWYNVALVRDTSATRLRCYVNGAEDVTAAIDTTISIPSYSSFDIGKRTNMSGNFTGNIDDFSVFSRALTTSEISDYYNGNLAPAPSSGSGFLAFM